MKKIILSVFGMLVMAAGLQAQELIKDNDSTTPTSLQNMAAKTT